VWAPQRTGDQEIYVHGCVPVMQISACGGVLMEEIGVHGMHDFKLNNCACMHNYVAKRRTMMRAFICDRGA
jgi:hypothetical protein